MNTGSIDRAIPATNAETAPFLSELSIPVRQALLGAAETKLFQKGDRIWEAGETPSHLGILLGGMVELCGTAQDSNCGVLILARGDLVLPMAAMYGEPSLTSATALTRGRIILIDRHVLAEQAEVHADLAMALARVIGAQWRMAVRHIIDLKCRSAAERLAAILLRFVDYSEEKTAELPFTKATLAARLGVSRETLSRVIQVVADHGIVLRGSEIIVRDRQQAELFCGPEPYPKRSERRLGVNAF